MSISKALEHLGAEVAVTADGDVIKGSDGAVLPGVGAFYDAMRQIEHLRDIIGGLEDRPLLGICLGLQLLFTESEEGGRNPGLDVIRGRVVRFGGDVKVPHMGWNSVHIRRDTPLFKGIRDGSYFYFVHSYYAIPEEDVTAATTPYGVEFPSVVVKDNVFATQFHPEKSGAAGLQLLRNYLDVVVNSKSI
ncbi:MAG: imidazole glycerol phosphate synthase subunit HisH [Methanobacteriota archaeon]|nr:MAG: imidazole glycerol phosphate synthase subunit HisH [Euryarchaeota archaeon]